MHDLQVQVDTEVVVVVTIVVGVTMVVEVEGEGLLFVTSKLVGTTSRAFFVVTDISI